jgi:hypothetical protein
MRMDVYMSLDLMSVLTKSLSRKELAKLARDKRLECIRRDRRNLYAVDMPQITQDHFAAELENDKRKQSA